MAMEDVSTCRVSADVLERLQLFVVTRWDRATNVYHDAERKRISALGEGFISVIQQNDPDHCTLSVNIPSAVGVRTSPAVVCARHNSVCRDRPGTATVNRR